MSSIDDVFDGSKLSASEKHASTIFGKLLVKLRELGKLRLKSLMDAIIGSDMPGSVITLVVSDRNSYDMLKSQGDLNTVNSVLDGIESGTTVVYKLQEKKTYNVFRFEQFLVDTFGRIVTIIRG